LLNPGPPASVPPSRPGTVGLELEIHPNPARALVTLRFRSPVGVEATLEVFDLAGRRVASIGRFAGGANARRATWKGEWASGGRAEAGLYHGRLSAGREVVA